MKAIELQKKSKSELKKLIRDKSERLRVLRFSLAVGKLKNVREIRETKRDIARMLTIMKHKT
jgi:large subunit ribosomal protein L29